MTDEQAVQLAVLAEKIRAMEERLKLWDTRLWGIIAIVLGLVAQEIAGWLP